MLAGAGIAHLFEDYVRESIEQGEMVELFVDWKQTLPSWCLYYPSRRHPSARCATPGVRPRLRLVLMRAVCSQAYASPSTSTSCTALAWSPPTRAAPITWDAIAQRGRTQAVPGVGNGGSSAPPIAGPIR